MAGIVDAELRVIENVKRLDAKLNIRPFLEGLEVLQQRYVEVHTGRIVEKIAPGVAEGKTLRCGKGSRVVEEAAHIRRTVFDDRL